MGTVLLWGALFIYTCCVWLLDMHQAVASVLHGYERAQYSAVMGVGMGVDCIHMLFINGDCTGCAVLLCCCVL